MLNESIRCFAFTNFQIVLLVSFLLFLVSHALVVKGIDDQIIPSSGWSYQIGESIASRK